MSDSEESISGSESESQKSAYKRIKNRQKQKQNQNKKLILNNSNEESENKKLILDLNPNNRRTIKRMSNKMKVFEKYHNLSIKELRILLSQKNEDIIKINEEKENSKKTLTEIINKLNKTITSYADILNEESSDPGLIFNLEKIKEDKKKKLDNSKKINNLFKEQLSYIKGKISLNEKGKIKIGSIDTKLEHIKKKNTFMKKKINEIKNKKVIQGKELEIISENKKYPLKLKIKAEDMSSVAYQKYDYFTKFNLSLKGLDDILKEMKKFDELYESSIDEDTDINLVKKINFWINLIKNDLAGDKSDILSRIDNGESIFLKEIDKKNENERLVGKMTLDSIENNSKSVKNLLTDRNLKKIYDKENNKDIINTDYDLMKPSRYFLKNGAIINKNKSSSLLYSYSNKNIHRIKNKSPLYINTNINMNILDKKTLFKKLDYLKFNIPIIGKKINLNNINNLLNSNKRNYYITQEVNSDIKISNRNNNDNISSVTNNNLNNEDLDFILTSDYNQITDEDYRSLLSKKGQYLESNIRLEKNINDIKRTKNKKLAYISQIIKQNSQNLEKIKKHNSLLIKEINNLKNVYHLKLEQSKLKNEVRQNLFHDKRKLMLKTDENNFNKDKDKLFNFNSSDKIKEKINEENGDEDGDDLISKERNIRSIEIIRTDNSVNIIKNETRESKLKMIKEKYKDEIKENDNENEDSIDKKYKNKKHKKELEIINEVKEKENASDIINENEEIKDT